MRTLKFRAWDKVEKKMRYNPFLIQFEIVPDGTGFTRVYNGNKLELNNPVFGCVGFTNKFYEANPDGFDLPDREDRLPNEIVLMQFTGLLDKNGKEIYEGDVVKWQDLYGIHNESVEWADYSYKPFYDPRDGGVESGGTEILGNLYENPELLPK